MESLRRRGARPRSGVAVFWLDLIFLASVFTDVLAQAQATSSCLGLGFLRQRIARISYRNLDEGAGLSGPLAANIRCWDTCSFLAVSLPLAVLLTPRLQAFPDAFPRLPMTLPERTSYAETNSQFFRHRHKSYLTNWLRHAAFTLAALSRPFAQGNSVRLSPSL